MTITEARKILVIRYALAAIEEYLQWRSTGMLGDVDIETLIMYAGRYDDVTADEAWNAIEESLNDAFHL